MANAKICDRCGEIYNVRVIGDKNPFEGLSEALSSFVKDDEPTVYKNGALVDLCPECSSKLKKWLKRGDLDD